MALKITYDNPDFPKGHEFEIRGLGVLENGKSVTLTEEQEENFAAETGQTLGEALEGNEAFKVDETKEKASGGDD